MAKKAPITTRQNRTPTPAELDFISRARIKCRSWREIAEELKAEQSTVIQWFRLRIEPLWKAAVGKHAHAEIARLDEIERTCWERFAAESSDFPDLGELGFTPKQVAAIKKAMPKGKAVAPGHAWLSLILSVIDMRCKIRGDYAPTQVQATIETGARVAGSTPAEEAERMLERLFSRVKERRAFEATLKAAEGSAN